GGWVGFQFIATLYMQQLRGWSPLQTGLAIFPGGLLVAVLSPRIAPLIFRFGVRRLIAVGMTSVAAAYALFLPIGLGSSYAAAMLPTFLLAGLGFALAFGPLNVAATNGIPRGAGPGRRAPEHVVPVRRRARARDRDRRQQRQRRARRHGA